MSFDGFIARRDGREVLTFEVDADLPRYGSLHPSPLGVALCVSSDLPPDLASGLARLIAVDSGTPPFFRQLASWLESAEAQGEWVLSHYIDNEVLSIGPMLPPGRRLEAYLADLLNYPSIQTDSRRLTFRAADRARLVDFGWDSECLAVLCHGSAPTIEAWFGLIMGDPLDLGRDSLMMVESARACQWGGVPFEEFLALDARYHLHSHEWQQIQSWLARGATSAAEALTARETIGRIEDLLS
ncbi:MAG: hypothetical protein KIH64_014165 [Mycobacterium sp.]|nr:hypothetical protein [Mycobacterium sp.]